MLQGYGSLFCYLNNLKCLLLLFHVSHSYMNLFQGNQLLISTPLTNRKYLRGVRELGSDVTPLSTATHSVNRLQSLLSGRSAAPSETLIGIFEYV